MGMRMEDSWCSIDEIATYLAVRRETIYRWIKMRKFPAQMAVDNEPTTKKEIYANHI